MLDTLIKSKLNTVIKNTNLFFYITKIKKKHMEENSIDYESCVKVALDNARKRISLLNNSDKKCVLEEYKEWINEGLNKHTVLVLREDPII